MRFRRSDRAVGEAMPPKRSRCFPYHFSPCQGSVGLEAKDFHDQLHKLLRGGQHYCSHRGCSLASVGGDRCEDRKSAKHCIPQKREGIDLYDSSSAGERMRGNVKAEQDEGGEDNQA